MNQFKRIFLLIAFMLFSLPWLQAQEKTSAQNKPTVVYGSNPRRYPSGGISVEGVKGYEDYLLIGISGLSIGDMVSVPGDEITAAVKRYWNHKLFSNVRIEAEKSIDRDIQGLCQRNDLRDIREPRSAFPFADGLACDTKYSGKLLLGHSHIVTVFLDVGSK
jgi:outer membrane protein insertion porin family